MRRYQNGTMAASPASGYTSDSASAAAAAADAAAYARKVSPGGVGVSRCGMIRTVSPSRLPSAHEDEEDREQRCGGDGRGSRSRAVVRNPVVPPSTVKMVSVASAAGNSVAEGGRKVDQVWGGMEQQAQQAPAKMLARSIQVIYDDSEAGSCDSDSQDNEEEDEYEIR